MVPALPISDPNNISKKKLRNAVHHANRNRATAKDYSVCGNESEIKYLTKSNEF
jgi:hypothetical protein